MIAYLLKEWTEHDVKWIGMVIEFYIELELQVIY